MQVTLSLPSLAIALALGGLAVTAPAQDAPNAPSTGLYAVGGVEAQDKNGARYWIAAYDADPVRVAHGYHAGEVRGRIEKLLAKHGLRASTAELTLRALTEESVAQCARAIPLAGARLACWQLRKAPCPWSGAVLTDEGLPGRLVVYSVRTERGARPWLSIPAAERAELLGRARAWFAQQRSPADEPGSEPDAPQEDEAGEAPMSSGDAATQVLVSALTPTIALSRLTPKALAEDVKDFLADPVGAVLDEDGKVRRNWRRMRRDLEAHADALFGRGKALDVLTHAAEEKLESLAKEAGRAGHKAERKIRKKVVQPVKKAVKKALRKAKERFRKIF